MYIDEADGEIEALDRRNWLHDDGERAWVVEIVPHVTVAGFPNGKCFMHLKSFIAYLFGDREETWYGEGPIVGLQEVRCVSAQSRE